MIRTVFICIGLFLSGFLSAQDDLSKLRVQYLVQFQTDTANSYSQETDICDLLIGDKSSIFRSHRKAIIDSLDRVAISNYKENIEGALVISGSGQRVNFRPEVYKKGEVLLVYNSLLSKVFQFKWNQPISWTITADTKTIENYICKKATAHYLGRDYEAWFTEQLPFQEGPYFFKGLPGLILEVYDTKDYYRFSLASISKMEKPIQTSIKSPIVTTYEKFLKARNDFFLDPIGHLGEKYRTLTNKKQQDERARQLQRYNNFMN